MTSGIRNCLKSAVLGPNPRFRELPLQALVALAMTHNIDIARFESRDIRVAHCLFPAWEANEYLSVSLASSISASFTAQRRAVVLLPSQRPVTRDVPANCVGTTGATPISWVRVNEPAECLEVTASPALRHSIADELTVSGHAHLEDLRAAADPIALMIMCRLRAVIRGSNPDSLEVDGLARRLYGQILTSRFGGRPRVRGDGGLSAQRLNTLSEWIEAHLDHAITVAQLAAVAALTPAHFTRSFKRSVGLSPYQFVRLRRLERARESIRHGSTVMSAAHAAGFASMSQFRAAYRANFGHTIQQTPRRGARAWKVRE
jgi:AraC family transcriptional regulator